MVDPFFQKAQATQNSHSVATSSTPSAQQEIQSLLKQQEALQAQYNQYSTYLQNPQITPAQRQQVQTYLQQFSLQYQQCGAKLEQLWYKPSQHVTKPNNVKAASGSRLSIRSIFIGCWAFFMVFVGALLAMFYYLIQNPNQLASIWLDLETTKNLLSTFSIIFFALVVFLGMGILIFNGYRLSSVKNTSKTKYVVGLFLWFFIFIFWLGLGYWTLTMIRSISITNSVDSTKLVLPYIWFKNGFVAVSSDPKIALLAPSAMAFKLNTDYFNSQILPTLGQVNLDGIVLDCGNDQTLSMNMTTAQFDGTCTYFKKGSYDMTLNISYTNTPTWEKIKKDISAGSLVFASEIDVSPILGELSYNDSHTEMSLWKVPTKVRFDASQVFSDLELPNYLVIWDINWDGSVDEQNVSSFTTSYKEAKLYSVAVRFPELNDYVYSFPLRVEQSDVPICEILVKSLTPSKNQFSVHFLSDANVAEYQYQVLQDGKSIYTSKSKSSNFEYQFPDSGIYSLRTTFITDDAKQGSCESDDISIGAIGYQLFYSLQYKNTSQPTLSDFPSSWPISFTQDVVTLSEIPTIIQFSLNAVQPNEEWLIKQLFFDNKPVISSDGKKFEVKVESAAPHIATFVVTNPDSGAKTEKKIQIITKRDPILGKLIIKPDIVWIDPFTVTFDASTTTLNDTSDEIVYFTWDFWDGEIKKNISQSIMQHTYVYNTTTDNGVYFPKIIVTTKKWLTWTITSPYPITVKKKNSSLAISIDSHPSQIAKVWDRVKYSLELNWVPKTIIWDFWNTKTLQCSNRDCIDPIVVYDSAGKYTVKVKVIYEDRPQIEWSVVIKVQ